MRIRSMQAGFAMIEVMVTVAIITVGISGMGMLLIRAIQGTQDSAQQSQAMWIVQDYAGRMRANPEGALAEFYVFDSNNYKCPSDLTKVKMCAQTFNDSDVDVCDPAEMAAFDNLITLCDLNSDAYDSASDFIVNLSLKSSCTSSSPRQSQISFKDSCVQYEITLTWDTKINTTLKEIEEDGLKTKVPVNENTYNLIVEFN